MSKRLLALAVVLVAFAGPGVGQAFAATIIVDDDGMASPPANCGASTPTFNMIEPAVEASNLGDTINVCPGTYTEQVSVEADENGITLRSLVFRAAVIKAPLLMTEPGDLVTITAAQNVTLRDFTIAGPLPDHLFCSLALRSGVRVIGSGSAIVQGNRITEMRSANPALRGCQNGFAIAVGRMFEGQTGRITAFDNHIDLYQKGGIYVDNVGSSADLHDNLVQGNGPDPQIAQNGIQISRGAVATLEDNRVNDNAYALANLLVFSATGILVFEAGPGTTIEENRAVRNDDNIGVYTTTGARILRNVLLDATFYDGIFMAGDTSDNRIEDNFLRNNAEHDCHDNSIGPNPGGVANFWIDNDGLTDNRGGALCEIDDDDDEDDDDGDDDDDDDDGDDDDDDGRGDED
jgi:hypothetical protein